MINRLVDRFGRSGFAAISSVIWALPMAAWAGSADLSPVDRTATPTIAFSIGVVMLVVWLVLVASLGRVHVSPRQRRFDIGQMSPLEKRWTLVCVAFATGLIAWLNGAATVDWGPLGSAIGAGKVGPILLAIGLALFALAMVAGIWSSWRKESEAFRRRLAG
jgi:membrane protease YdiL (CAAX protease family)